MNHAKYIFIDPATMAMPATSGLYKVYKDHWWLAKEGKLAFYYKLVYPQCHRDEATAKLLAKRMDKDLQVIQVPFVFVFVPSKVEEIL